MVEDFLWTCGDAASEIEIVGDFNARFVVEKQLFCHLQVIKMFVHVLESVWISNSYKKKPLEKNVFDERFFSAGL